MHSLVDNDSKEVDQEVSEAPSEKQISPLMFALAVAVAFVVMAVDLLTPLGVAGGVPYVALVLIGWWLPKRGGIFFLAVVASVLTIVGYYFSPEGGIHWIVLTNRAYALFAIWVTAVILWVARKSRATVLQRERELIKANKEVEKACRVKSEFLANVSHELRTPLNAVIGFSSVMKSEMLGPLGGKYTEYANDINYSGEHLLGLINNILDVSSVESGKMVLNKELLDVRKVAANTIRIARLRAEEEKIRISTDISKNMPQLYADELRIRQILLNLLSNAIKFTPPGGVISLNSSLGDDGTHILTISDTGIGMSEEELVKAMSKFGQIDSGYTRRYKGTGLGLPLAKELTELHGGIFDIYSENGKGTTVTLSFPPIRKADIDSQNGLPECRRKG